MKQAAFNLVVPGDYVTDQGGRLLRVSPAKHKFKPGQSVANLNCPFTNQWYGRLDSTTFKLYEFVPPEELSVTVLPPAMQLKLAQLEHRVAILEGIAKTNLQSMRDQVKLTEDILSGEES